MDFLRDPLNKKELFAFLTSKVEELKLPPAKAAYVTSGQAVVSIGASTPMKNCNHEEADTRVVVHIAWTGAGGKDYSSAYRRYRCCSHPCRHIP